MRKQVYSLLVDNNPGVLSRNDGRSEIYQNYSGGIRG